MVIKVTIEGKTHTIKNDGAQFVPEYTSLNKGPKGDKNKEVSRDLGYFTSLGNAVHRLITETLADDQSEVTLMQYVLRYENAVKECRGMLEDVEF